MSYRKNKPFYRYEDVPLLLAPEGGDPIMVFANSANISASQPINARKFVDDYNISFAFQKVNNILCIIGLPTGGKNSINNVCMWRVLISMYV